MTQFTASIINIGDPNEVVLRSKRPGRILVATVLSAVALAGCVSAETTSPGLRQIMRVYATAPYARMIVIPSGYETIRLPGIIADPLQPAADGKPAVWGDTEQQAESVFGKIKAALAEIGAGEGDVMAMTVYLVAPPGADAMDFDGMGRAYARHYGNAGQPHRPVRSTVEVAGLVRPEMLVEIEVTAARPQSDIALPVR